MKISVGVSNRHVHLKQSDLEILFGEGYELHSAGDLTQPGMFKAEEVVTIKTDKNIDACFLPEIEKYFKNTLNLITERKSEEEHKQIYDKINIDSE